MVCIITFINTRITWESRESVLFQQALKAYPMHHSWIITAHVSLGNLEKKWRMFIKQMDRTSNSSSPNSSIVTTTSRTHHISYKPLILAATQLLKKEPSLNGVSGSTRCVRRSLLPFLGDALSWLTGTATTKDVTSIKQRVNQLISIQHSQQETLVHVISILNITRYSIQVNRQHIKIVMNTAEKTHQDVTTLYNFTHLLYSSLSYQQILLHIHSILANLRDLPYYIREFAYIPWIMLMQQQQEYSHLMDYLWKMLEKCYYTLKRHYL